MNLIPDVLFRNSLAPAKLLLVCWPLTCVKGGSYLSCDIQWVLVGSEKLAKSHHFFFPRQQNLIGCDSEVQPARPEGRTRRTRGRGGGGDAA